MNDTNDAVLELREADRYIATEPLEGTCAGFAVLIVNLGSGGAQIRHPQPLRIGTEGTLTVHYRQMTASVQVQVVWSQLGNGFLYRTGVQVSQEDPSWSAAVDALLTAGAVFPDDDSLSRKRERDLIREERRKSGPKASVSG